MDLSEKHTRTLLGKPQGWIFPERSINAFGYIEGVPAFDSLLSIKKDVFTAPHTLDIQIHQKGISLILQQNLNSYYFPVTFRELQSLLYYPRYTFINFNTYESGETPFERHLMGPLGKVVSGIGKNKQDLVQQHPLLFINFGPENREQTITLMALERKRKSSIRFLKKKLGDYLRIQEQGD